MDDIVASCAADLRAVAPAADDAALESVATRLVQRWQEPHRTYHGLRHLAEVLAALGRLAAAGEIEGDDLALCRVGAWFHDAVHEGADSGLDEEASAHLAVDDLDRLGAPVALIERVAELVLATARRETTEGRAVAAMLDADLWILGSPHERFDDYCREVRAEYPSVSDADYAVGRREVLTALLADPAIYATATARQAWEHHARENLERELARLG